MTTEPDGIGQTEDKSKLTARQVKFLPVLLASPSYSQACRAGRVSRDTLYAWLAQPEFKAELDKQRNELVAQGFALLFQSVRKAVETLVGLLDDSDGSLKRLAAKDILDQHAKYRELDDLTCRIEAIEQSLAARR
jgi:hypothetical protein